MKNKHSIKPEIKKAINTYAIHAGIPISYIEDDIFLNGVAYQILKDTGKTITIGTQDSSSHKIIQYQ